MSTHGLPYYFEDTTGLASGPTDFLDIYDRPPFLRLSTSHPRSPTKSIPSLSPKFRTAAAAAATSPTATSPPPAPPAPPPPPPSEPPSPEPRTLKIFELAARTFITTRSPHTQQHQHHHHHHHHHRRDSSMGLAGTTQTPSAVLALDGGRGIVGSVKFRGGTGVALERWLKKSSTFGSTLTRQFKASDGMYYRWSFRSIQDHEWACVQLGTNHLVAHYDVRPSTEPVSIYQQTSGNVLTVQESCVHLSVEILASLIIMRHIRAQSSY